MSTFVPQVNPNNTTNKGKKASLSSNNNGKAKSNDIAASRSLDSTNDSLTQVTLEQENNLLKWIIERGVFKNLSVSKIFEKIVRKQGEHRKKQCVGYFNIKRDVWEEGTYPIPKFVPQKEKYDPTAPKGTSSQYGLLPEDHKG